MRSSMTKPARLTFLITVVVLLGLLTTACDLFGQSKKGTIALPKVTRSGALTMLGNDPTTLDPALAEDVDSAVYIVEIFSGLVTLNHDLQVVPDLAEKWDVSDDGKTYTFHLRKGAKFHDGREVKAADFQYSFERALDPKAGSLVAENYLGDIVGAKEMLDGNSKRLQGLKVVDDYTLQLTIDAPKVYFLAKLTYPTAFVVDRQNVEGKRNWTDKPNGTGPFKLQEWKKLELIVLARNENFYNGVPSLERVNYILSGGSGITMYENGEVDVTGVPISDIDRVLDPNSALRKEATEVTEFSTSYIAFDVTKPPFDDVKVRQAFAYALDREKLVSVVLKDEARLAKGILPPGFPGYNESLKGYEFDPQKAKALIAESKYKDPASLPRMVLSISGEGGSASRSITAIVEMWKQNLGADVEIEQVESATFLSDLKKHKYQMFALGWIADYPDPENFLDILFHSKSPSNNMQYANPAVDRLLEQARTERDTSTRVKLYRQAEEMIVSDAPWIPLTHPQGYVLVKPYVEGFANLPMVVPMLKDVSLKAH